MSASWKLKITVVGSSRVGKTSFIRGSSNITRGRYSSIESLGVSFEILDSYLDNGDLCTCSIWELRPHIRCLIIYPTFFKGAAGSLLFFDLSRYETFEDLNIWIKLIRKINGNIPVILIGTKDDLEPEVYPEEINNFMRNNGIISYYSTSVYRESRKDEIVKQLMTNVIENRTIKAKKHDQLEPIRESVQDLLNQLNRRFYHGEMMLDKVYSSLSDEEKAIYDRFIEFFSVCPICENRNDVNYLKRFYFSNSQQNIKLRKQLLKVMELSEDFDESYGNKIILGIPCCDCFRSFFNEKLPI